MSGLLSASGPITAIFCADATNGSAPSFFSSTIDLRATSRAAAMNAGVITRVFSRVSSLKR